MVLFRAAVNVRGTHVLPRGACMGADVPASPARSHRSKRGLDQHVGGLRARSDSKATSGSEQETFVLHDLTPVYQKFQKDERMPISSGPRVVTSSNPRLKNKRNTGNAQAKSAFLRRACDFRNTRVRWRKTIRDQRLKRPWPN